MKIPHQRNLILLLSLAILVAGTSLSSARLGQPPLEERDAAGQIIAFINGRKISLPMLKTDYQIDIQGDVASVQLTQSFINPSSRPINATYLFPLNQKAAVYAMQLETNDEVIKAVIHRKQAAKAIFDKAKSAGKAAALLVQLRPNMFTQNIANLMPGETVKVVLNYVQNIAKLDGAYELVVPMIVGPRYEGLPKSNQNTISTGNVYNADETIQPRNDEQPRAKTNDVSGWKIEKLPTYPKVIGYSAPKTINQDRVSLSVNMASSIPISRVFSTTHSLAVEGDNLKKKITFAKSRQRDNRDLIIRYALSSNKLQAGALSHFDSRGGYMSLMIEPPKVPAEETIGARELVFVLDTSGSMGGEPIEASKVFMETALESLRPDDYFRILRFSSNTSQFAGTAVLATPQNISAGKYFIRGLSAGGGTEMNSAINAAFDTTQPASTTRIVVFLTDGYIGGDRQVIRTIRNRIGKARIFAFGIGRSVNRFLLEGIASEGRGYVRYVDPGENAFEVAKTLAADLKSPLLTDITIDWNGLKVSGQSPILIPDLFAGGSIRLFARYNNGGEHKIFLNGMVNGRRASMPLLLKLSDVQSEPGATSVAIPIIWAREQIFQKNRDYTVGTTPDAQLKEEITRLGLNYSLQTRFTSFVAVSKRVVNPTPGTTKNKSVPLPKVSGVSLNAYPKLNLSGSSTPEPQGYIGFLILLAFSLVRFWKRLKAMVMRRFINRQPVFGRKPIKPKPNNIPSKGKQLVPDSIYNDSWWLEPVNKLVDSDVV